MWHRVAIWTFVTIIIIVTIHFFINMNRRSKTEGLTGNSGNNHNLVFESDLDQAVINFKLNQDSFPTRFDQTIENPRTNGSNYMLFKTALPGEKPELVFNETKTINLMTDYFEKIWDSEAQTFRSGFIDSIFNKGYYVEPDTQSPMYFITYRFIIDILRNRGADIDNLGLEERFAIAQQICGDICKNIHGNNSTVLTPVFSQDDADDPTGIKRYGEWMFFIIVKQPAIEQSIPLTSDPSHPLHPIHSHGQRATSDLNRITKSSTFTKSTVTDTTAAPNPLASANTVSSGILFYLGNCRNFTTGWTNINAVTINNNGLQLVMCPENAISESSGELITDPTYIDRLPAFDKYLTKFTQKLDVDYTLDWNRIDTLNSIDPNTPDRNDQSASWTLKWNNGWWPEIDFQDNTTPIARGNQGTTRAYGERSFDINNNFTTRYNTLNVGQKGVASDIGIAWNRDGSWEFSQTNPISRKYYPKTAADAGNNCYLIPVTFSENKNTDKNTDTNADTKTIPYHNIEYNVDYNTSSNTDNQALLQIDSNAGTVIYTDTDGVSKILFNISNYGGLTPGDLASNSSWPNISGNLGNGRLGQGDILGVNGGNKEYLMDSKKKMRLWFDIHGTMHVEISLKRDNANRPNILRACAEKYREIFFDFDTPRQSAGNYYNLFNYSGTPLNSSLAVMLLLMFSETQVSQVDPDKLDPLSRMGLTQTDDSDGEPLQLFFNPVTNTEWNSVDVPIDTTGCQTWFKHSNIYENNIDLGHFGGLIGNNQAQESNPLLIKTIRNNSSDDNGSSLAAAQAECGNMSDCYGITTTTNKNGNISKLWRQNGIERNYHSGAGVFNTGVYDGYLKICPTRDSNTEAAGFHGDSSSLDYSVTPLTVQTIDADLPISQGEGVDIGTITPTVVITSEIIDQFLASESRIERLRASPDNNNNSDSWYHISPENMASNEMARNYIKSRILENIASLQNKIPFSQQTNREVFYGLLADTINREITQPILYREQLDPSTLMAMINTKKNNSDTITDASEGVRMATSAIDINSKKQQGFTNIDNNTQYAIKKASDDIMKKMVFNIDDGQTRNKSSGPNLDMINITILVIFVSILIIGLTNHIKRKM